VRGDAAGDGHALTFGQRARIKAAAGDIALAVRRELVLERENALGFKRFELGLALFDE
jgi:hypothetical protein